MLRSIAASLVIALMTACSQVVPLATPPAATPAPAAPQSDAPAPSADPEPSDTPAPAAPTWEGHPAAGLALVRLLSPADPESQVFIVEADGTFRQVTGVSADLGATFPVWAPDGSRIAFTGSKRGETTVTGMLAVVNADGSEERQVGEGQLPKWSPDGTTIAFQEVDDVTGTDHNFYLVDPETGETTDLGIGHEPRWVGTDALTYVGSTYAADGLATQHVYLMDLVTGQSTLVEDWAKAYPAPDGSAMVLIVDNAAWLAEPDGTAIRELVRGAEPDADGIGGIGEAVWSPDGTHVAVHVDHDNDANPVWTVVDLEGNEVQADIVGAYPTWSPDGTRLALEVYRQPMPVIQVVDVASGEVVWEDEGRQPAWRPAG